MSDADKAQAPASDQSAELARLQKENAEIRALYNRRDAEISALRKQATRPQPVEPQYEEEEEPRNGGGRYDEEMIEQMRFENAEARFLLKNPDARDRWEKVEQIISQIQNDPINGPRLRNQYVAFDNNQRVNWSKMFADITRDLELAEVKAARATAAAATPAAKPADPSSLRVAPIISGGGLGTDLSTEPDLENMTPEDMLKAGLVPISTTDIPGGNRGNSSLR